ncbi:MAG: DUF3127 domain-containing protein [Bacteroidales bacterium]
MQFTAKITLLLPIQTGLSKNGEWKKQDIIVETEGQYPKKICVSVWGDKINETQLQIGNNLQIDFDIESREYNSKWYTDIKAWKVEVVNANSQNSPVDSDNNDRVHLDNKEDILPF